jgi:imidazolonepropionase-like amidohydrolase
LALIVANCTLFDGIESHAGERRHVYIEGERIREISTKPFAASDTPVLDAAGRFVMPGLIDAHFHAYGSHLNPGMIDKEAPGY